MKDALNPASYIADHSGHAAMIAYVEAELRKKRPTSAYLLRLALASLADNDTISKKDLATAEYVAEALSGRRG
jgi:hypothetical protein